MDMELEKRYRIAEWIAEQIAGILSEEEQALLEDWRQASPEHEEEYERIIQRLKSDLRKVRMSDGENEWRQFERKLVRGRKIRRVWYYAAVISVGITVLFGVLPLSRPDHVLPLAHIESKGLKESKAILILGDGREINLTDTTGNVLVENEEVKVSALNNMIRYDEKEVTNSLTEEYNTLIIPRGGEYELELADGTRVWLNSESKLVYPVRFTGNSREVQMEGEVCFQVAKNEKQPFVVKTKDVAVKVLGTFFNVEAYPEKKDVITTLVEGRINVSDGERERVVEPGQQIIATGDELLVKQVRAEEFVSWTRGVCFFTDTSLEQIMEKLSRWYDVEVVFTHPSLRDAHFTLEIKRYDNISDVLVRIEKTERVKFRVEGNVVTVDE